MRRLLLFIACLGCASVNEHASAPAANTPGVRAPQTLRISPYALEHLRVLHHGAIAQGREYIVCLEGHTTGNTITVENVRTVEVVSRSATTVSFNSSCASPGWLGFAHTHLPSSSDGDGCYMSRPDWETFRRLRALVEVVTCGPEPEVVYALQGESSVRKYMELVPAVRASTP